MKRLVINDTFAAAYSDGFHEMNSSELIKFYGSDSNRCGIYDEDSHTALIITWTTPKLGFLADARSVLNGAKARMKHSLQNYSHVDTMHREIAGCTAIGERFEYTANCTDIVQYGDLYVFKYNKLYYGIQLVARKESFEESQREMEQFLQSLAFMR